MANVEYQSIGFSQLREQPDTVQRLNELSSVLGGDTNVSDYLKQKWHRAASAGICKIDEEIAGMYIAALSNPNFMPSYISPNLRKRSVSFMSFAVDDRFRGQGFGHGLMKHFFEHGIQSVKQELNSISEQVRKENEKMINAIDHPLITLETANPAVQYLYHLEASKHGYVFESPLLDSLKQFRPVIVYIDTGETQGQLIAEYKSVVPIDIPMSPEKVSALRVQRDEFSFPKDRFPQVARGVSDFGRKVGAIYDRSLHEVVPTPSNEQVVRKYFSSLRARPIIRKTPLKYMLNPDEFRISCILPEDR